MAAHTAGRIGGSIFSSKKLNSASINSNEKQERQETLYKPLYHYRTPSPVICSGSSIFVPTSPIWMGEPMNVNIDLFMFVIVTQIVILILFHQKQ